MAKYSIEIQDHEGNIYYPHSESATTFFDDGENLDTKVTKINNDISTKAPKDVATTSANGLMSKEDKAKLNGIEAKANNYVHPDSASVRHVTDTEKAKWNAKAETTVASTTANGLMSSADKTKLDGIATGANKYVHPNDINTRHVTDAEKNTWNAKASTSLATTSANGLMSSADKTKLDGIATGANKYVHPSDSNTRHVTDAEKTTWNGKASTSVATTLANGLMSKEDKVKLDGIAQGANAYTHPSKHPASIITEDATHRFLTDAERKLIQAWENFKTSGGEISGNLSAIQLATKSPSTNYRWAEETHNTGYKIISSNTNPSTGDWREEFIMAHDGFAPKNGKVLGTSENPWNDIFIKGISKNTNGYTKLPNGMILQWGTVAGSISNGFKQLWVNFPITFPNTCHAVICTPKTSGGYDLSGLLVETDFNSIGLNFNIRQILGNVGNHAFQATWIAIGY